MSKATHHFSQAPQATVPRSTFNRSFAIKTTFDAGYLIPVYLDEIVPGDTFRLSMTGFSRLATPIYPIMDNMFMESFFFFVPTRLVWDNWKAFNGERKKPTETTDYLIPSLKIPDDGFAELSIFDYFGLPTKVKGLKDISCLPLRCFNLIYNEWFRDENLIDSLEVPTDDGPDDSSLYSLKRRGKRYDYFTSCLPWPQKGPAVCLPLDRTADIVAKDPLDPPSGPTVWFDTAGDNTSRQFTHHNTGAGECNDQNFCLPAYATVGRYPVRWKDPIGLKVKLSDLTCPTINALRQAFQVQKMYERDARGGTRYTEIIQSHFGVISPDARQQRPEYLGGGTSPVVVNPIAQTSSTKDQASPLGNLAAYGTCTLNSHSFNKSFTEHGFIIGLVAVRADLTYQKGLDRLWSRRTRFDFYWPALSHLGEQAVLNKEIYAQGSDDDNKVFGYQERYAEYRYKPALITGKFRSNATGTLDAWHLSQDFKSLPKLSQDFIEAKPPVDRIEAVPSQ
uniref:Major capsid protein n=1 Tax=Army ant associated microvirus 1 TaxID=3004011 RepID=A0A9Y1MT02_9VIRU|nr:MAG: major capsid protein [Army ant associated microvirus 1]